MLSRHRAAFALTWKALIVQYIEVASVTAGQQILQKCQNQFMPCGISNGRRRPVTITQVSPEELMNEVSRDDRLILILELILPAAA